MVLMIIAGDRTAMVAFIICTQTDRGATQILLISVIMITERQVG